ncbi:hypothetical protein PH235_01125 [Trichococcus sp. K1Tr]|uniref:hypothetical protein n=1 Tax=Trichococcus sp. K1Tr TaxID=3020847 RepID=UPI0023309017|nr:hypothetical protein [Trichococcus sp. K1Tr]MDB6352157.1 hypothetical protein [Trichococcus sp. K1Tr]
MKIELMKQERMGVEGKGVLRSLQNDTLPLVDLLIREAFQNSLDATIPGVKATNVNVGVCQFDVKSLAEHLEGLTTVLIERYANNNSKAIYISDKNTMGLIGDVRTKEGNIYNLIYTIQKNQEQAGAGGSWGLGKTSYFRLGNGIVLYYSRVQLNDGTYEERLAGSLIEDSTQENRLLDNNRGIAWWGRKDKDKTDEFDSTYPLTDHNQILTVLDVFGIKPYIDGETGTTIIIPFIDEEKLLPKHEDECKALNWWETSLESAIEIAIQKWYAPRILNPYFDGAYLIPSINGNILSPDKFQPFFKIFYDLYLQGIKKESYGDVNVEPIKLSRRGLSSDNGIVGWISYGAYDNSNLKMLPPDNECHPLEYFGYGDVSALEKTNTKIVAYARKPGMIVEYDINGDWSKDIQPFDDKFLFSFFIPNSEGLLYEQYREKDINTLEDYLRKTEKSDHAKWEDIPLNNTKVTIIERIKRNNSKVIDEKYNGSQEEIHHSMASVLGKKIGDKLLPKNEVVGKSSVGPTGIGSKGSTGQTGKKRTASIDVIGVETNESNDLIVLFNLGIEQAIVAEVSVDVRIGTKNYDENNWKKDMGNDVMYPFSIQSIFVEKINDADIQLYSDKLVDERLSIHFTSFGNLSSFRVKNNLGTEILNIQGKLLMKVNDGLMQPTLVVCEVK